MSDALAGHGTTSVTVEPLGGSFGVSIQGLDLAAGPDEATMEVVTGALYDHRLVVIRDQRMDQEQYLAFGRAWGTPIPHVLDHIRMAGFPEMVVVGNTEKKDREDLVRNGAALWHTDQSYEEVPASATMLYSLLVPDQGGETQFCDMASAYDGLDEATKERIDDLRVAHKYGRGRLRADDLAVNPLVNDEQDSKVPPIHHPLVMRHPVTGRKGLYALGHGAHAIEGVADDEATELLAALADHALDERYLHSHRYRVGDVAIWDTFHTMHRATPIDVPDGPASERLLWRISVRGRPAVVG